MFKVLDIEFGATIKSAPMICPNCGCKYCKPASIIDRIMRIRL